MLLNTCLVLRGRRGMWAPGFGFIGLRVWCWYSYHCAKKLLAVPYHKSGHFGNHGIPQLSGLPGCRVVKASGLRP